MLVDVTPLHPDSELPLHPAVASISAPCSGHSLGAGSAILLKILVDSDEEIVEAEIDEQSNKGRSKALDAGRPVHVECYAFGPPPVFSRKGAEEMRDVFSFVNG